MLRTRQPRFIIPLLIFVLIAGSWDAFTSEAVAAPKKQSKQVAANNGKAKKTKASITPFKSAQRNFAELRERDPECSDLQKWEDVAASFRDIVENGGDDKVKPASLFNLGRLYERTFRKRGSSPGLTRALFFYEMLARNYPGNPLADDALLALGDLRRSALKDEPAARAAYFEIIDMYPKGDVVDEARKRVGDRGPKSASPLAATSASSELAYSESSSSVAAAGVASAASSSAVSSVISAAPLVVGSLPKRPMIVIDPGHGGEDEGAVGVDGTLEKEVVLNIGLYLDELLRERLRAQTLLTRARDVVVPLAERIKIANDAKADLFVSIHTNATPKKNATGIETYYLDNTNDQSSLKLAERENASVTFGGGDLAFMISDLIQNLKLDESISLAHHIQGSLVGTLGKYYPDVKGLGVKKAPFYVLVGAHMPCVLTEVSFIDHPVEGARLVDRKYQKFVAEGLYRGIRDFFEKQSRG